MRGATNGAPLSFLGVAVCRACDASGLSSVLDLGEQPLANKLLRHAEDPSPAFPLHLRICPACALGQVGEFVQPEEIFSDYPYLSSVSTSWVAHAANYARRMVDELSLTGDDLVVEVASNDGYLLEQFQRLGIRTLGVEPADNVADIARGHGVETLSEFFGGACADRIVEGYGRPRLVVANNVMAHVPDLNDFVAGFAKLCRPDTVITVENPAFLTLLTDVRFDTIYHEHFSYLSAHAVRLLVAAHGLELVRVEHLSTHGGSNRYWIMPANQRLGDASVERAVADELSGGLLREATWQEFRLRSRRTIEGLRAWLDGQRGRGAIVSAYGAAAKGNTLLNAARASGDDLVVVADGSVEKQGKYLPGSRVPIVEPERLVDADPAEVLILPWNIAHEIEPLVRKLTPRARSWIAVPQMAEVTA